MFQLVIDSTAFSGSAPACVLYVWPGSWTRLSSMPPTSNCISWRVLHDVTSGRVDVADSLDGLNMFDGNFNSQCFMSASSDDIAIHSLSATYTWDVRSQAVTSRTCLDLDTSVSRWCVVALNLEIFDNGGARLEAGSANALSVCLSAACRFGHLPT